MNERITIGLSWVLLLAAAACGGEGAGLGEGEGPRPGSSRPAEVILCYSPAAEAHPATRQFWETFEARDLAARPAALTALEEAVKEHPQEEQLAVLRGLGGLWRVAEPTDAEAQDMAGFVQAALTAKTELERAYMLCPTDHRLPAWLGPILVNMGRSLQNQATIDEGLAILQQGIDRYPAFVLFSRLLIFADRRRDDPEFQRALQAVIDNVDACGDVATSTDPACINSSRAVHNIQGSSIFLGDVFAKAGRREDAVRAYGEAQRWPTHGTWPYQHLLKERIETVDARIQAFADPDPTNDPESVWTARHQCAVCHQR